ncbi:MAG: hypothetical protein MI919_06705, partial [Holophagales bacterium]|nr:hypothetical protein [Holophagales bacterium]
SSWVFDTSTGSLVQTADLAFDMPGVGLLHRESVLLLSDGRVVAVDSRRSALSLARSFLQDTSLAQPL